MLFLLPSAPKSRLPSSCLADYCPNYHISYFQWCILLSTSVSQPSKRSIEIQCLLNFYSLVKMSSVSNGYQLKNLMRNICYRRAFVIWLWDSCLNIPPLHNWWPALPQLPCLYLHKGSGDCLSALKLIKLILHSFLRLHLCQIFFQIYLVFLSGHRNYSLQLRPSRLLLQSSAFKPASVYAP